MVVKKEYMKGMKEQLTRSLSSRGIISPPTRGDDGSQVKEKVLCLQPFNFSNATDDLDERVEFYCTAVDL